MRAFQRKKLHDMPLLDLVGEINAPKQRLNWRIKYYIKYMHFFLWHQRKIFFPLFKKNYSHPPIVTDFLGALYTNEKDKFAHSLVQYYSLHQPDWTNIRQGFIKSLLDKSDDIAVINAFDAHGFQWALYFDSQNSSHIASLRALIIAWHDDILQAGKPADLHDAFTIRASVWRCLILLHFVPILKENISQQYQQKLNDLLYYHIGYIKFFASPFSEKNDCDKTILQLMQLYITLLERPDGNFAKNFTRLKIYLQKIIEKDGFIKTESIRCHSDILLLLYFITEALTDQHNKSLYYDLLRNYIDQMASALRFMHDLMGATPIGNDGAASLPKSYIPYLLNKIDKGGKPHQRLRYSGFEKLQAGSMTAVINFGIGKDNKKLKQTNISKKQNVMPALSLQKSIGPAPAYGALSLSLKSTPVIVQMGMPPSFLSAEYLSHYCKTAAYSTLVLDDTNPSYEEISPMQHIQQTADGVLLESLYKGYIPSHNMERKTRIFLAPDGKNIRVEEQLSKATHKKRRHADDGKFDMRLHFHPKVKITLVEKPGGALITIPNHGIWHFISSGGNLALDTSIYWGGGTGQACEQLIISGQFSAATKKKIKWALYKDERAIN